MPAPKPGPFDKLARSNPITEGPVKADRPDAAASDERSGPFARVSAAGAPGLEPGQTGRLVRELRPIPDPRLDAAAIGTDSRFDPLTTDPHGSTRSARRFAGEEHGDAHAAPSPSDQWFATADTDTSSLGFGPARLVAMLEASRPLRIAATIILFFVVLALVLVFLKSFTSVLG